MKKLLAASLVSGLLISCGGGDNTGPSNTSPPVLSVPIVDLSQVTDFLPFGYRLRPGVLNPAYELITASDTLSVLAATAGKVTMIASNPFPQNDSEIHIQASSDPSYLIVYDHLISLRVGVGAQVTAGQVIGRIGPGEAGRGRTEIQVNQNNAIHICPRSLGSASFNAAHDVAMARFPARGSSVCLMNTIVP